jgi:hypothetical protein
MVRDAQLTGARAQDGADVGRHGFRIWDEAQEGASSATPLPESGCLIVQTVRISFRAGAAMRLTAAYDCQARVALRSMLSSIPFHKWIA